MKSWKQWVFFAALRIEKRNFLRFQDVPASNGFVALLQQLYHHHRRFRWINRNLIPATHLPLLQLSMCLVRQQCRERSISSQVHDPLSYDLLTCFSQVYHHLSYDLLTPPYLWPSLTCLIDIVADGETVNVDALLHQFEAEEGDGEEDDSNITANALGNTSNRIIDLVKSVEEYTYGLFLDKLCSRDSIEIVKSMQQFVSKFNSRVRVYRRWSSFPPFPFLCHFV